MGEDRYQKELFEIEKPKKQFPRLAGIFKRSDLSHNLALTIPMERLMLIAIGLVMVMVIVFALGVEKGKALKSEAALSRRETIAVKPVPMIVKPAVVAQKAETRDSTGRPYTIVAVTLSNKNTAQNEAARLVREGFDAFVYQSDPYLQVCVGSYAKKDDAKAALNRLKRIYKDAYVRSR